MTTKVYTTMTQTQNSLINDTTKEELRSFDNSKIQERVDSLSKLYATHSERINNDLQTIAMIQAQVAFCVELMQERGIKVEFELPEDDEDGS